MDRTAVCAGTPELGDLLVGVLRAVDRFAARLAARRRDPVDRAAQHLLVRLVQDGPQRTGALAEALLSDPSTVSRHAAHLVQAGLVERTADPTDGRATLLAATGTGVAETQLLRSRRNALLSRVVADWSQQDRDDLARLLARFATDLDHHRSDVLASAEHDDVRGDA